MPDESPRIVLVAVPRHLEARLLSTLRDAGFDVTTLDSAGDCLRFVARDDVDGVVSGYALPDLDGVRLLRSIRVSHPGLPFVLILESASPAVTDEAVAAGVSGYVPADADPSTILARLQAALDRDAPWFSDEHQRRYRHLIEMAPVPITLFDDAGESIWCNDATLDLLGLDGRDELVGRSIFEFVHPHDRAIARRELTDVVEHKEPVGPTQMKLQRPDGEVRYVQVSTAAGQFLGKDIGQAVVVDVTPLREVQRALQDERRFVEEALDTLQDVFYVVDAEGSLLRWNDAVTDATGYDDGELASMNVAELFADTDVSRVRAAIETVVEEGSHTVEATLVTKHGHTCPYEFRGRRLDGGGDDGPRVVGIGRDISHRKERKRQLKALEQWLRHNIRNDVNVIHGTAENVREGRIEDVEAGVRRIERYADHLLEQADRERRIVEILTDPIDPIPIDLADLAGRRVDALRERYPDADIALIGADSVVVAAIPDLSGAVDELIENAVKYADCETPTVRVAVVDDGARGLVRVTDEGPGIPDIERETLDFDRDIDQLHHGSGLGLLFVYWVTRLSAGDMSIDGSGDGSTVTLALPVAQRE
jgi:PAS domain S-box-containing protein